MAKQSTNEEFLDKLEKVNPYVEVREQYIKSSVPIECKCKICGHIWKIRPNNLLRGYGCPVCGLKKRADSRRKDHNLFVEELRKIDSTIEVVGKYQGAQKYVACRCKVCGHEWDALGTNLLGKKGCPICAYRKVGEKLTRTHEEFVEEMGTKHPDIQVNGRYQKNSIGVSCTCKKCGYTWDAIPSGLLAGGGCPRCAGHATYTQEEFLKKMEEVNPFIEILGEYVRSAEPILCRCKLCGYTWDSKPNYLMSRHGCPRCNHTTTSFLEQAIYCVFKLIFGEENVLLRDRKTIGYELDILVPQIGLAIEPGSWRWHFDKQKRDTKKRKLCREQGIRLITIYSDYSEQKPPYDEDCIVVPYTFGLEAENKELKELIFDLLKMVNISFEITEDEWRQIILEAYRNSRRKTTEEFINEVKEILPDIIIEGEYNGALNPIRCKCNKCSSEWDSTPHSLLAGHGCMTCSARKRGKKRRKDPEEFEKELHKVNPDIVLLGKYVLCSEKIRCKCSVCGNEWVALPSNLLKGRGCPRCARVRKTNV